MRSPTRISRSLRQTARGGAPSTTTTASMRWLLDRDPAAGDADLGPQVGGRVEVVRRAPSRSAARTSASCSSTARQPSGIRSSSRRCSAASVGAETLSVSREKSSLVRPISKCCTSNCAAALDHRVEDGVEDLRVDEVPFGIDDLVRCGRGHDWNCGIIPSAFAEAAVRSVGSEVPPYVRTARASEYNERATRTERAVEAARESACRGVRGAKPLGK